MPHMAENKPRTTAEMHQLFTALGEQTKAPDDPTRIEAEKFCIQHGYEHDEKYWKALEEEIEGRFEKRRLGLE